ncbi:MAG: ferrous iron transport protein B [Deltaproteobacteria bacterium]|nr:ferrous iron transport protein B [Deltaproteobacteria bacterium]
MINVALAGQPNCGKSTIFNMLSGVNQHVANYPGVTVDKMSANVKHADKNYQIVDLPGTYSFSMFSLEEKVAKTFLLDEETDVIVNVVDASNLRRNLYLTFQILELGKPVVLVLNMMDIAARRKIEIDTELLSQLLNVQVVEATATKKLGKAQIMEAVEKAHQQDQDRPFKINYHQFEPYIAQLEQLITLESTIARRWLAIKTLEGDEIVIEKTGISQELIEDLTLDIHKRYDLDVDQGFASLRYDNADTLFHKCVKEHRRGQENLTNKIDRLVLNKWLAFPVLGAVIYLIYQLSIVGGYKLTNYTWPLLASLKNWIIDWLPPSQFIDVPPISDFVIWMVNSTIALLNYVPIFFILFVLIAILEDVGYMPRMAFILDRVFKKYGLHGQSTLPLVLGGALVGGCAVPGVMATKGIADERARLATILTVPYMNCMAKVPFYTLLLGAFFQEQMTIMMFYISTVTLFIALIVARLITSVFLSNRETAPFIMELPAYHLPTVRGVLICALQRVWLYMKKVVTIVLAVAIILFVLLQYPGVPEETMGQFRLTAEKALSDFDRKAKTTRLYQLVDEQTEVFALINLYDQYKAKRMITSSKSGVASLNRAFLNANPELFPLIRAKDHDAKQINKAVRKLSKVSKKIRMAMKSEKIRHSFLGMFGRALEPVTQYCGFDWRVNVAFLSSFAARESAVATLGSIYEKGQTNQRAEDAIASDGSYTPLHAVAMLIFMILTPPCIATMVVVKLQANSYRWMAFAIIFPTSLGLIMSSLFFTMATTLGWSGEQMMQNFYLSVAVLAIALGFIKQKNSEWSVSE